MSAILFPLPGNEAIAADLATSLKADIGKLELHRFPDGETNPRFLNVVKDRDVVLVCTLDRPDEKFLPLVFAAATARERGAKRVGLVAPYLAYMRQDRHFETGDAKTAPIFAKLLSQHFDWLVTVDPHLHRIKKLEEIYEIPARAIHAAEPVARWIADYVADAVLIGPDEESAQWVEAIARDAGKPFTVLTKTRHGDRDVKVSVPHVERWRDATPVLVDDIISTGRTMAETLGHLSHEGLKPAICIGVHAVFAPGAFEGLRAAGAKRIVTTNTIPHETNAINISSLISDGIRDIWSRT